jgi:hypothetical protein
MQNGVSTTDTVQIDVGAVRLHGPYDPGDK